VLSKGGGPTDERGSQTAAPGPGAGRRRGSSAGGSRGAPRGPWRSGREPAPQRRAGGRTGRGAGGPRPGAGGRLAAATAQPRPVRGGGLRRAARGQGRLAGGLVAMRQPRRPWAPPRHAAPEPLPGARPAAGEPEAWGRMPPRRHTAICGASIRSCGAWPPGVAGLESAGPRTLGLPAGAQRSASQGQVQRPSTPPTTSARQGASAWSKGPGAAGISRGRRPAPAGFKTRRARVRACQSMPREHGCGWVETRLRSPPREGVGLGPAPADHGGLPRRGPPSVSTCCT
jgi:hypothetical protein